MSFLTVLIVWALLQLWGSAAPAQNDTWLRVWWGRVHGWLPEGKARLLLAVGLPVLAALILEGMVDGALFGLLSLLLSVAILLYSLGRGDFSQAIADYLERWRNADFEAAYEYAERIGDFHSGDVIRDAPSLHQQVRRAVLHDGLERWFAPIFWFICLGPAGALAYRLSYMLARRDVFSDAEQQQALRLVHYLDYLPARLLTLAFALTADFVGCVQACKNSLFDNLAVSELLDNTAAAALHWRDAERWPSDVQAQVELGEAEVSAAQALLSRSVLCWLVTIAVLQLL